MSSSISQFDRSATYSSDETEIIPLADLAAQNRPLLDRYREAMEAVISSADFILGNAVEKFENEFADYLGVAHAVGVASGLDALRLSLMAHEIGPGTEVILPANTFIATALAISSVGATPVFVDCDLQSFNLDASNLDAAITPRTRAILPVHLTGLPVEIDSVTAFAERHDLVVIEDVAQATGAEYRGRRCGTASHAGCFSFYPGKNLGALGDGGLVATNDPEIARKIRQIRNYGQLAKYEHVVKGLNSRLDSIQAAVLSVKLPYLDCWNTARAAVAESYRRQLAGVGDLQFQSWSEQSGHVHHLFIVLTDRRDALKEHLTQAGVQTGIHYPVPIHLQPAYLELGYQAGAFPNSEHLAKRMISLPIYPELRSTQIESVVSAIKEYF